MGTPSRAVRKKIPPDPVNDYTRDAAEVRQAFLRAQTGVGLDHVSRYGCYGTGKMRKLTEIVAATVLCGELSLGWAILAEEWVTAHDLLGRNRP